MPFIPIKKEFVLGFLTGFLVLGIILSFSLGFETVARAVTFDSDIVPVAGSWLRLGVAPAQIRSINNTMFFDGQTVGIGASPSESSSVRLDIASGGLKFSNLNSPPPCDSTRRGTLWFQAAASVGQKDVLSVCYRDYTGAYSWSAFRGK